MFTTKYSDNKRERKGVALRFRASPPVAHPDIVESWRVCYCAFIHATRVHRVRSGGPARMVECQRGQANEERMATMLTLCTRTTHISIACLPHGLTLRNRDRPAGKVLHFRWRHAKTIVDFFFFFTNNNRKKRETRKPKCISLEAQTEISLEKIPQQKYREEGIFHLSVGGHLKGRGRLRYFGWASLSAWTKLNYKKLKWILLVWIFLKVILWVWLFGKGKLRNSKSIHDKADKDR